SLGAAIVSSLERDVVVGGRGRGEIRVGRGARGHVLVRPELARLATRAQELDRVGDDLDRLALPGAVLRLPLAPVEPPVDGDGTTLREELRAALALVAPHRDVE